MDEIDSVINKEISDPTPRKQPVGPGFGRAPRALLRPLKNPHFDTERYDPNSDIVKNWKGEFAIPFFVRPIKSKMFLCEDIVKTDKHTSMSVSCMLPFPTEYSILGFNYFIEEETSPEDIAALINGSNFRFFYAGHRMYAEFPVIMMPQHRHKPEIDQLVLDMADELEEIRRNPDAPHKPRKRDTFKTEEGYDKMQRFEVGRAAIKIYSGEMFRIDWVWDAPPKTSKAMDLMAVIEGLNWTPL